MKHYFRTLITLLLAGVASTATAQLYITDDNFEDSVSVHQVLIGSDGKTETLGEAVFNLPMGETVKVERLLRGQTAYGLIRIDGKEYGVSSGELLFSDENPEGTEDIFGNTRERVNHTVMGKFFATMTPYWIIAILFITSMAFTFLGLKVNSLRRLALIVVPATLLTGSAMEVWAYSVLGNDTFWWCDPDRYGFFGSLFRAIPFMAIVAFQFYSVKFYMRLISMDADNKLSIKPMLLSIGLSIPAFIVAAVICGITHVSDPWLEIIVLATFLITLGIGTTISVKRNIAELGKSSGIAFSLFGVAWCVGCIVALWGLIMVIFQLLIQLLMVIAIIIMVAVMSSVKTRYRDSNGNVYEEDGFGQRTKIN
jgi:membrane protein